MAFKLQSIYITVIYLFHYVLEKKIPPIKALGEWILFVVGIASCSLKSILPSLVHSQTTFPSLPCS